jgi:hypothetical protein
MGWKKPLRKQTRYQQEVVAEQLKKKKNQTKEIDEKQEINIHSKNEARKSEKGKPKQSEHNESDKH